MTLNFSLPIIHRSIINETNKHTEHKMKNGTVCFLSLLGCISISLTPDRIPSYLAPSKHALCLAPYL